MQKQKSVTEPFKLIKKKIRKLNFRKRKLKKKQIKKKQLKKIKQIKKKQPTRGFEHGENGFRFSRLIQ